MISITIVVFENKLVNKFLRIKQHGFRLIPTDFQSVGFIRYRNIANYSHLSWPDEKKLSIEIFNLIKVYSAKFCHQTRSYLFLIRLLSMLKIKTAF